MAPETKIGVARNQHFIVNRSVWVMANRAAFAHGFMLKDKRPSLRGVALATSIVLSEQCGPAALDGGTFVRIVAIAATHLAAEDGMAVRELKLSLLVQMTFETNLRGFFRVDNGISRSTSLIAVKIGRSGQPVQNDGGR